MSTTPTEDLAQYTGEVWSMDTILLDFKIIGFRPPFVAVRRNDGVVGTLEFTKSPRVYFDFQEVPSCGTS